MDNLSFNHGCGGDHRISWADFAYENAYGHDMPVIERPIARRLRLHDPHIVDKFNELREEYCRKHNLAVRTITNEQRATYPPSVASNKEHEEIDRLLVASIRYTDKGCRKIHRGAVPWSPDLKRAELYLKLIKSLLIRRQHNKISSRKGQRDHREICNNADEHRLNFLVDLANARAEANDTNLETELSNLQGWELQRRIHAKIIAVFGRASRPSLTRLTREVTLEDGTIKTEEAVEPEDLAIFGAEEYEGRVHLTEMSDLMQEPMVTDLEYKGTTDTATSILDGTYVPPPGQDPYTTAFLQQLGPIMGL
eukprot:scaffold121357_cov60-Attheya_sp.AAC.6